MEISVTATAANNHENEVVADEAIQHNSGENKASYWKSTLSGGITMEETHILDLSENVSYVPSKSVVGRSQIPVRNQNTGRHKSDQNSHGLSPNRGSGRKTTACTPHLHPGTGRDNTTTSLLQMPTKPKERMNFINKQNLPQKLLGRRGAEGSPPP